MTNTQECRGYDVSQFQSQGMPDWHNVQFGIARATYGNRVDCRALLHVTEMRKANAVVGLYHFFCATVSIKEQIEVFRKVWSASSPDLIPWIDVEDYPGHTVSKADLPLLLQFLDPMAGEYGKIGLYLSRAFWIRLGAPKSLLNYPLWVPHWPMNGSHSRLTNGPSTPGGVPPALWQCMVGPQPWGSEQNTKSARAIDQDIAPNGLDALRYRPRVATLTETICWEDITDTEWHAQHYGRDHTLDEP